MKELEACSRFQLLLSVRVENQSPHPTRRCKDIYLSSFSKLWMSSCIATFACREWRLHLWAHLLIMILFPHCLNGCTLKSTKAQHAFGFYRNTHNFSPSGISFFPRNLIFVFCFLSYRVTLTSKHLVSHAHSCTRHLLNWGESGPAGQWKGKCVRMSRRVKSEALRDEPFDIWEDPEKTSCLWVNYYSPLQLINTFLISHIKKSRH